jgi:hypothetical protein
MSESGSPQKDLRGRHNHETAIAPEAVSLPSFVLIAARDINGVRRSSVRLQKKSYRFSPIGETSPFDFQTSAIFSRSYSWNCDCV